MCLRPCLHACLCSVLRPTRAGRRPWWCCLDAGHFVAGMRVPLGLCVFCYPEYTFLVIPLVIPRPQGLEMRRANASGMAPRPKPAAMRILAPAAPRREAGNYLASTPSSSCARRRSRSRPKTKTKTPPQCLPCMYIARYMPVHGLHVAERADSKYQVNQRLAYGGGALQHTAVDWLECTDKDLLTRHESYSTGPGLFQVTCRFHDHERGRDQTRPSPAKVNPV